MDSTTTEPITATAHNRAGTISVRTTDSGLPVDLRIDPHELRYGAQQLADRILDLNRQAALEAAVIRGERLAAEGVPREILDRMRLPSRADLAAGPAELPRGLVR
ncbi:MULTISPECIES: hypothetical protein [Rhodococcus]|uniref:hypothetical protein n=1 Tax=Rhodococcus TaxID=1827 RepID=UPI0002D32981|nr:MULTISPECIES: hypothetical protein [Rhodococcus]UTT47516.1 hypothetical protein NMQ04_14770 [Rhodococcus gordoniae]